MKERIITIILCILLISIFNDASYANKWNNGEFIVNQEQINLSDFSVQHIDLSSDFDFWHYSGGYWKTNYYENNLVIDDSQMEEYLSDGISILNIGKVNIKYELPQKLHEYLENGGDIDNIKFSTESSLTKMSLNPSDLYKNREIKFKISGDELSLEFEPSLNVDLINTIEPQNGYLNILIPTINPKFGFPLFSIWKKDGTSLGNTNIGNIADIPEGHAFLDGRDSTISIDTSNDIINPQGDLVSKSIGIWNTVPSKYTITEKSTDDHRIGVGTFANGGAAGMKFILPLRMYYPVLAEEDIVEETDHIEDVEETEEHTGNFEGSGVIKAMTPNAPKFDVSLGIPSSEEVYTQVIGKSRLTNYAFEKVTGNKDFSVTVKRKYTEKWKVVDEENSTEDETVYINKRRSETISKNYTVNREYSYYKIDFFENYGIHSATVFSDVLLGSQVELIPNNYTLPEIILTDEENIVSEPSVDSVVTLSSKTVGKNETPSSPNWSSIADNAVGTYQVRNDQLVFDSEIIMDASVYEENTPTPKNIPEADLINGDVLKKENIKIGDSKRNGNYSSTGTIVYNKTYNFNGTSPVQVIEDIAVNAVQVHTPIYSELLVSNVGDDYNQQIDADINDRAIILGMPTKFRYQTTGNHRNILGYGNRNYDDYISKKEIKFPFDIYYDATTRDPSKYVRQNTWVEVDILDTDIYVPIWVDEGEYTVQIRSKAINSLATDDSSAAVKNTNDGYYIVEDEKAVKVIGRLYGFKIRDINDYPIWEEVFRTKTGSYEFIEGNNYPFGGNDENGNILRTNPKYFLPIAPGSHPQYTNAGSIPLGYKVRFTLETIGNYLKDDAMVITPSYSFMDYEGNENQNIKIWSKVRMNGNDYLIELSTVNQSIKEGIPYIIDLGNPYITLTAEDFENISESLELSLFELKKKQVTIGFADEISLSEDLRTYIGDTLNKPATVSESKIKASRQKWYGEYWLPDDTYVLDASIDLKTYAAENNGIDFTEDIFMRDGFLKTNFQIKTKKDAESFGENLSYKNAQSNMYQLEGFHHNKAVNINGTTKTFLFEDGDVILYDVNRKRSDDYDSYGTH